MIDAALRSGQPHAPGGRAEPLGGALEAARLREDFPQLATRMRGRRLVYLDSAASTLKPRAVIERVSRFYEREYANVHRGVYELSERATDAYEQARRVVQRFLGARSSREVIFCRGATEAINLVAATYGRARVAAGDEVLVTGLEHHSNLVPWQLLCEEKGARLRAVPVTDAGDLDLDALGELLGERTRIVAVGHISNAIGTVNPVAEVARRAHALGAAVVVDGAQAPLHAPIDVQALGCDFYAFSGHKALGPTGIGALFGRAELLADLPPYQGGGEMVFEVTLERTTYAGVPHRFEAGTPNIAGAIGLAEALRYIGAVGIERIRTAERELLAYAEARLGEVEGVRIIGRPRERAAALSFTLDGVHPHDVGTVLDAEGIAIRAGHHCAQPLMRRFGVPATARASLALYNTREDIDALVAGVRAAKGLLG